MSVDRHDIEVPAREADPGAQHEELLAAERFAVRSGVALVVAVAVGAGFGVLAVLARTRWEPMQRMDQRIIDRVVSAVSANDGLRSGLEVLTRFGSSVTLVVLLALAAIWLAQRGQQRLAVYVILTSAGGFLLNVAVKAVVERLRPEVDNPVYTAGGWSFPSGHSMNSLVCYGILLLVFTPVLGAKTGRAVIAFVTLLVVAIGFSRIALGVHYATDVVGGWLLGALWLASATFAYLRWREDSGLPDAGPLPGDLPEDDEQELRPVPNPHAPILSHPWRGTARLAVAWLLIAALLIGLGMSIRALQSDTTVLHWDHAIVASLSENRNGALNSVLGVFGEVGNTAAVIVVALIVAVIALGARRDWRPALFLATAMVGEITLFLATTAIVERDRPRVDHLNPDLPPTSSFPSGHVAAALTLYLSIAVLLWFTTTGWPYRVLAGTVLLIPVLVAVQRLYAGAHHPTDILGSITLAVLWTTVAWRVIDPVPARASHTASL
ncbi:phosphatase PAP2 family protein [Nocardia sp. NPDC057668]|uniref:phosphatase PAP2 family protein n=1 Tax=Nocardia sp. NPDC057668 TaxID=3346202 RepID=UPI00366A750D